MDSRNRYSLSQLQLVLWTVLIVSAWLAIMIGRIAAGIPMDQALLVEIPGPVVAALGLSTGSFAIAPGVKGLKAKRSVKELPVLSRKLRDETSAEIRRLEIQAAQLEISTAGVGDTSELKDIAEKTLRELDSKVAPRRALVEKAQHLFGKGKEVAEFAGHKRDPRRRQPVRHVRRR